MSIYIATANESLTPLEPYNYINIYIIYPVARCFLILSFLISGKKSLAFRKNFTQHTKHLYGTHNPQYSFLCFDK